MNLSQLRAFHAVAMHRSFSAAAQALGVSQPAVTQHIKSLEDLLGARLFHRGGNGVDLTIEGRDLLPRARQVVLMVDDLGAQVDDNRALRKGYLTLGICAPFVAMPLIGRFMELHPGVKIEVRLENSERLFDAVAAHRIDLAIATVADPRPDFVCEPLAEQRVLVLVPATHSWSAAGAIDVEQLRGATFVTREAGSMTRQLFERGLKRTGVEVETRLVLGSREALKEAVAAGLGFGIVLDQELGSDPRLVGLAVRGADMRAQECLVVLPELAELGVVRAFRSAALGPS